MSLQKGNTTRSRPQKYQNKTTFKNDLHDTSHKTKSINNIEVANVCVRCKKIIEWKIKYKKYKPLKIPAKCIKCEQKSIKHAYHTMCLPCAKEREVCPKCGEKAEIIKQKPSHEENLKQDAELQTLLKSLSERKRRAFIRYMNHNCGIKNSNSENNNNKNNKGSDKDEETSESSTSLSLKKEDLLEQLKALVIKEKKDNNFDDDFSSSSDGT